MTLAAADAVAGCTGNHHRGDWDPRGRKRGDLIDDLSGGQRAVQGPVPGWVRPSRALDSKQLRGKLRLRRSRRQPVGTGRSSQREHRSDRPARPRPCLAGQAFRRSLEALPQSVRRLGRRQMTRQFSFQPIRHVHPLFQRPDAPSAAPRFCARGSDGKRPCPVNTREPRQSGRRPTLRCTGAR